MNANYLKEYESAVVDPALRSGVVVEGQRRRRRRHRRRRRRHVQFRGDPRGGAVSPLPRQPRGQMTQT